MKERQKDLKFLSEEEYWKLQIFFANGVCCVFVFFGGGVTFGSIVSNANLSSLISIQDHCQMFDMINRTKKCLIRCLFVSSSDPGVGGTPEAAAASYRYCNCLLQTLLRQVVKN